jgi:hypothetical protein
MQLLCTIRLLAGGSYQQICADVGYVSQPSLSRIVDKVILLICELRGAFIRFPDDLQSVTLEFFNYGGFPGVIGCIDGTHIPITKPRNCAQPEIYRCRKGFYSLNVQLICGPDYRIYNVVARWPGSTHDSRIFTNSTLKNRLEEEEVRGLVLADSGYPCLRYLMTPLRNPITAAEKGYNRCHIKTRNTVERCIGILKNRFRCLINKLHYQPAKVGNIVVACVVLHNLCIMFNDEGMYIPDPQADDDPPVPLNIPNATGNATRLQLINNFFA